MKDSFLSPSAYSDDSPATIHLALGEFPVLTLAFAKLDGRDPCALGFSEIGDQKGVAHIHIFKWIGGSVFKEDLCGSFFY